METLSELQRENRELHDRKELLELRQQNRNLKRQIARLESGKPIDSAGTFLPFNQMQWVGFGSILFLMFSVIYRLVIS